MFCQDSRFLILLTALASSPALASPVRTNDHELLSALENTAQVKLHSSAGASESLWQTYLPVRLFTFGHHDAADVAHDPKLQEALGGKAEDPNVAHLPVLAYPAAVVTVAAVVIVIFRPRGFHVVLGVLVYLGALSSMMITVKCVLTTFGFVFPKFLTFLHFMVGGLLSLAILAYRSLQQAEPFPVPSFWQFVTIVPVAAATALSIGSNNMALTLCSVAFAEIIASMNCVFTIPIVLFLGMPFNVLLLFPTALVVFGAVISISGEIHFSALGFMLGISSNVFRSLKGSLQQKLLTDKAEAKLDPCALLFYISASSTLLMLAASLASEGLAPWTTLAATDSRRLQGLLLAIGASCLNATVLNLAQLFVTRDLGAVGAQLTAQSKSVLVILGSMVVFGDPLTWREMGGFVLVLAGVYWYARWEQQFQATTPGTPKSK